MPQQLKNTSTVSNCVQLASNLLDCTLLRERTWRVKTSKVPVPAVLHHSWHTLHSSLTHTPETYKQFFTKLSYRTNMFSGSVKGERGLH